MAIGFNSTDGWQLRPRQHVRFQTQVAPELCQSPCWILFTSVLGLPSSKSLAVKEICFVAREIYGGSFVKFLAATSLEIDGRKKVKAFSPTFRHILYLDFALGTFANIIPPLNLTALNNRNSNHECFHCMFVITTILGVKSRALFGDGISHLKPILGHFKPPYATLSHLKPLKTWVQKVPKRDSSSLLLSPKGPWILSPKQFRIRWMDGWMDEPFYAPWEVPQEIWLHSTPNKRVGIWVSARCFLCFVC